jgi:hypothetical protein
MYIIRDISCFYVDWCSERPRNCRRRCSESYGGTAKNIRVTNYYNLTWYSVIIFPAIATLFLIGFLSFKGKYKKSCSSLGVVIVSFVSVLISLYLFFIFSLSYPRTMIGIFAVSAMHPEFWDKAWSTEIYNTTFKVMYLLAIFLPLIASILISYYSPKLQVKSNMFKWILLFLMIIAIILVILISLNISAQLYKQSN